MQGVTVEQSPQPPKEEDEGLFVSTAGVPPLREGWICAALPGDVELLLLL